jgi:hypothetical protein
MARLSKSGKGRAVTNKVKVRGRLTVALGGAWRLYTALIPSGSRAIGTITRAPGDTGALVWLDATGLYIQVNSGSIRSLPQSRVAAAVAEVRTGSGGPGRGQGVRAVDGATGLKRRNISVDDATVEILRKFGDGDFSLGIRRAAAHIKAL